MVYDSVLLDAHKTGANSNTDSKLSEAHHYFVLEQFPAHHVYQDVTGVSGQESANIHSINRVAKLDGDANLYEEIASIDF